MITVRKLPYFYFSIPTLPYIPVVFNGSTVNGQPLYLARLGRGIINPPFLLLVLIVDQYILIFLFFPSSFLNTFIQLKFDAFNPNMLFFFSRRSLCSKALLLILPIVIIVSYFSFQQNQLPKWHSVVPSFHPHHDASHAANVITQDHKPGHSDTTSSAEQKSSNTPAPAQDHKPSNGGDVPKPQQTQTHTVSDSTAKQSATNTIDASALNPSSSHFINGTFNTHNSSTSSNSTVSKQSVSHANDSSFREKQIEFWRSLEPLLAGSDPDCESPKRLGKTKEEGFNPSNSPARPDLLEIPKSSIEKMQNAHTNFVEGIKENPPEMVFTPGSQGLVSTAGGKYLPVFVISLRMLRRTGTTLPVEVFLADHEEYEAYICKEVLPSLSATCVIMSDILESVPHSVDITRYQFKVFAMMFSSFEEILFLDADCFPIHNPEQLFSSEPFRKHGLITWPDFWASSASPLFYQIASQSVPPMTERATSETGELLLSKTTHQRSLLLATYYNYYGPTHYYPLLSQGGPGEGDKETFLAAASVMNETFYATSESVQPIGHMKNDGGIDGSAMVQYDPVQDYALTQKGLWRVKDSSVAEPPRPFFVHAHFPKFNPATIFHQGGPTKDSNGNDRLAWTDQERTIKGFGVDLERRFWEEIKWTACELEDKFESWQESQDICKNAKAYWNNIYGKARTRRTPRVSREQY